MQSVSKTANVQPRTGTFPGTVFSARETCCIDCRAFPSNVRSSRVLGRFCLVSCVFVGVVGSVHSCHAETLQGHVSAPSEEGSAKWVSRRVSDQENIVDPEAASEEQEWTGEIEQALSRRLSVGEKSDVTCGPSSQENVEVTAAVGEYTLQASFTCADPFNTSVLPAANEPTHCLQEPEGTSVPIQQVLQVEGSFKESPEKKYTVTLAKMPDREKVIYYKCNGIAAKVCRVAVKMPEKPAANVCTLDGTVELTVDEAKEVEFVCNGESTRLEPAEANPAAYKGATCDGPAERIDTLVPGSTLKSSSGTHTFTVTSLPKEARTLCFKCVYPEVPQPNDKASSTRTCKVIISVVAAAGPSPAPPSASTTTAATTGSAYAASVGFVFAAASAFVAYTSGEY